MARLIISSRDGKNGILELSKPVTTIGRGNANDLVLNDSSVSRFHAVIKLRDDSIFVADRGSTNGIILNDKKISQETEFKNGDTALVGSYKLRLESVDDQGIQVRKGQWPSTLNNIIRGRSDRDTLARSAGISSSALTDLAERIKKLERENYLLTVLYEAGKALNSKLALEHICEQVVSLACLIEGVERGFVMLFDESGEVASQSEVRYRDQQDSETRPQIILSKSVLEMIRSERQPILIEDVKNDERFSGSESMKISGLRSAMCAPLQGKERLFGILYVDNLEKASAFTQEELNVF
ncbi:MAG TPA: FHA domain-containing protein, partial [Candidatus Angelobacter sp.]|nr:FHA domain-containing protein [Candidatus Angelobacter sp.]